MSGAWCISRDARVFAISADAYNNRSAGWTQDDYANAQFVEGAGAGSYDQDDFTKRFGIGGGRAALPRVEGLLVSPEQLAEMKQPRVIRRVWLPTPAAMTDEAPIYSTEPVILSHATPDGTVVDSYERGTGPGDEMLMPPELNPIHAYGHKGRGGANDEAACPDASLVSDSALTLWSDELDGDVTRGVQLNFGVKRPGRVDPGDGITIRRVPDGLEIQPTNGDAELSAINKRLTLGEYSIPFEDGAAGQVLSTDGAGTVDWADAGGGSGSGDVTGPASSTAGNVTIFADGTGKVVSDSGVPILQIITSSALLTNARLVKSVAGAGGTRVIEHSGLIEGNVVTASANIATGNVPLGDGSKGLTDSGVPMATLLAGAQADLFRSISMWRSTGTGGLSIHGGVGVTSLGTASGVTWATTNFWTQLYRTANTSAAAANSRCGIVIANNWWIGDAAGKGGFDMRARWGCQTTKSNMGIFVGMETGGIGTGDDPLLTRTNIIGIGATKNDTNLQLIHNDGSGNINQIDLGSNFPAKTAQIWYVTRIWVPSNGSTIFWQIKRLDTGDEASGSVSSEIPANTVAMGPQLWAGNGNDAGAVDMSTGDLLMLTGDKGFFQ